MSASKNTIILYLAMTLIASLSACGDLNIKAEYNEGGNKSTKDNLYAGTCGTWDIAGEYDMGYINGRCELHLECGATFEFEQSDYLDGDFHTSQNLYGKWVYDRNNTCGQEGLDPYDMCQVRDVGDKLQVDCYNVSFDMVR